MRQNSSSNGMAKTPNPALQGPWRNKAAPRPLTLGLNESQPCLMT